MSRIGQSSAPLVTLVAPAGYGKTTLMGQVFSSADRPVAWLSLDGGHRDPKTLLEDLGNALTQAGLLPEGTWEPEIESSAVLTRGIDQLLHAVNADAEGVLFIDQVDDVETQSPLDVIGALMLKARGRLELVVASRSHSRLPFGLLRARGDLLELTAEDLALDLAESEELLRAVGIEGVDTVSSIFDTTEGWPVATYLMALAVAEGAPLRGNPQVRGDHVYLADYFREQLIENVPSHLRSFLLRSSVLSRMSGELCDYVLETEHSAKTLTDLEGTNLLVIPLDRTRTWYRYHSLLQGYLRSELHRQLPEYEPGLHERASTWFEAKGFDELAMEHARAADDQDRVASLLTQSARSLFASGQYESLSGWLDWLEEMEALGNYPELAAIGAFAHALGGDAGRAERNALFAYNDDGHPRRDADMGPLALMVRACLAPRGVDRALVDARAAHEMLQHDPEWAHVTLGVLALATVATDGIDAAEPLWTVALLRSDSIGARPALTVSKAMRAITDIHKGDWESADMHLGDTVEKIEGSGLGSYVTSSLALVAGARIAIHKGDLAAGRSHMAAAMAIRPQLTYALPVYSVLTLHQAARAYIELADIAGARRVMRDAESVLAQRPQLGTLLEDHEAIKKTLAALPTGTVGPSSLTGAELRLLPLLVTHLTYPEIGERLYVSKYTVKTQAMSIYRKLGVSSRNEAVMKAREIGLITT